MSSEVNHIPAATFERGTADVLGEAAQLSSTRGAEYGDSWDLNNMVTTMQVWLLRQFGITLTKKQLRLLDLAVLSDVKDSRHANGPYKRDSLVDCINYRAVFAHLLDSDLAECKADGFNKGIVDVHKLITSGAAQAMPPKASRCCYSKTIDNRYFECTRQLGHSTVLRHVDESVTPNMAFD